MFVYFTELSVNNSAYYIVLGILVNDGLSGIWKDSNVTCVNKGDFRGRNEEIMKTSVDCPRPNRRSIHNFFLLLVSVHELKIY